MSVMSVTSVTYVTSVGAYSFRAARGGGWVGLAVAELTRAQPRHSPVSTTWTMSPVAQSISFTCLSQAPVATMVPSGLQAMEVVNSVWPV